MINKILGLISSAEGKSNRDTVHERNATFPLELVKPESVVLSQSGLAANHLVRWNFTSILLFLINLALHADLACFFAPCVFNEKGKCVIL